MHFNYALVFIHGQIGILCLFILLKLTEIAEGHLCWTLIKSALNFGLASFKVSYK